jgi:basic membrane protein A
MLKRVDIAVYDAFDDVRTGNWSTGFEVLGLAEGGVDFAMDEFNATLVSDSMLATVENEKRDVINGTVRVHDYMSDNACPY